MNRRFTVADMPGYGMDGMMTQALGPTFNQTARSGCQGGPREVAGALEQGGRGLLRDHAVVAGGHLRARDFQRCGVAQARR